MKYESFSPADTELVAKELAKQLKIGDVVCLDGDLGAGKTAFTKGLCAALGVLEPVYSPTYTIINNYDAEFPIYHIDAYRIEDIDEMYEIGFEECINNGICVIEWSCVISDILPKERYNVIISRDLDRADDYRSIEIISPEERM